MTAHELGGAERWLLDDADGHTPRRCERTAHLLKQPRQTAAAISIAYVVLFGLYIALSSTVLASNAASIDELWRYELAKGLLFAAASTLGVYATLRWIFTSLSNAARESLAQQAALIELERKALAGSLALSIAHDINNALVGFKLTIDAGSRPKGEDMAKLQGRALNLLEELVQRLSQIGEQTQQSRPQPVSMCRLVEDTVSLIRAHRALSGCTVRAVCGTDSQLMTDPTLVQQILLNLLLNAADANEGRGTIEVNVDRRDAHPYFEVNDQGPGVPGAQRSRIFEPFRSTKGKRTGIGLFSVRLCAKALGARVEVDDAPGGGASFRVLFQSEASSGLNLDAGPL